MTDTTEARRALLSLLLDRVEREALLPAEAPLLRPLVAADQADADRAEQAEDLLHIAHETSNRAESIVYRLRQAVREARAAARPRSELAGFVEQMTAILDTPSDDEPTPGDGPSPAVVRAELDAAQAAVARVRELAERWRYVPGLKDSPRTSVLRALDGPSPTPDDTPPTTSGPLGLRVVQRGEAGWVWECHHCGAWSGEHYTSEDIAREYARTKHLAHIGEADDDTPTTPTDDDTDDDEQDDEDDGPPVQCWHIEPGTPCDWNRCEQPERLARGDYGTDPAHGGLPTPRLDALRAGQPVTVTRCSPLVNAYCPGHTDGSQCDRAPSNPITPTTTPDWTTLDDAPRTYRLTADGNPIERTVVVPADDAPSEPQQ